MSRKVVIVGVALILMAIVTATPALAAPSAQAPGSVRIGQVDTSDYPRVTLYVNVLDSQGRTVEGLQRPDFQVVEGGEAAAIVDFAGLDQQRPVDVVFVFDTTGSMTSQVEGLKETCAAFADTLARQGRDYRLGLVTFWDEVKGVYPSSGNLTGDVQEFKSWLGGINPETGQGGNEPENPYGAIKRASEMGFRSNAQKVLILITDASPHHYGDGPDEGVSFDDPDLNVGPILDILQTKGLTTYVVAGDLPEYRQLASETGGELYAGRGDFTGIVEQMGQTIAAQYRFTYRAPRPAYDGSTRQVEVAVRAVKDTATYTTPTERRPGKSSVELYNYLRTPLQISTDPKVIGTNLFLAILVALLFGLTSTVLNDTLNSNRDAFDKSSLGRLVASLKGFFGVLFRPLNADPRRQKVSSYIQVALFLFLTALIACFLEPSFRPFSWVGVGLFFSMLFSVGLVNLTYEGSQVLAARRFHLDAALKVNPAGVATALGCVFFSRLVGFLPGYMYGVAGGYVLGSAVELSRRREATIGGTGMGATALLALLAWVVTIPSTLLQGVLGASGFAGFLRGTVGGLQSFLLTLFFIGLEVVFLEMFPLGPTNGAALFRWSKVGWGAAFGVTAFVAFHTLLTPDSAYLDSVRSHSMGLLLGMLALFSTLTVGLWLFFELRKRRVVVRSCPTCGRASGPAGRFCTGCGMVLPPPTRPAVSRQGLVLVIVIGLFWVGIVIALILSALRIG